MMVECLERTIIINSANVVMLMAINMGVALPIASYLTEKASLIFLGYLA